MITEKEIEEKRRWHYLHERDRANYKPWSTFTMMVFDCHMRTMGVWDIEAKEAYDIVAISKIGGLHMTLAEQRYVRNTDGEIYGYAEDAKMFDVGVVELCRKYSFETWIPCGKYDRYANIDKVYEGIRI